MNEIISTELREKYFLDIYEHLMIPRNQKKVLLTRDWVKTFPTSPGVYCFFKNGKLRYVGESGKLSARMADMLNTKNHNLRRLIGEDEFSNLPGYEKANSKKSFIPKIENLLNNLLLQHFTVSCLPIHLGRKEFEDWLQDKHPEIVFYNKKKKRK